MFHFVTLSENDYVVIVYYCLDILHVTITKIHIISVEYFLRVPLVLKKIDLFLL